MEHDDRLEADFAKWRFSDAPRLDSESAPSAEDAQAPPAGTSLVQSDAKPVAVRRARTPQQLERQHQVFQRSIAGQSIRAIAAELKMSPMTVQTDIREESDLRASQIEERRGSEVARAIATYEDVIAKALAKSDVADGVLNQIASGSNRTLADRYLETVISARTRIDKLMGIETAVKVDVSLQPLWDALNDALPD